MTDVHFAEVGCCKIDMVPFAVRNAAKVYYIIYYYCIMKDVLDFEP